MCCFENPNSVFVSTHRVRTSNKQKGAKGPGLYAANAHIDTHSQYTHEHTLSASKFIICVMSYIDIAYIV